MKTKHYLTLGIVGIALAGMVLTGCKKKDTQPTNTNTADDYTASQDDANGAFAMQDSKTVADGIASGNASFRTMSTCWTYRKITDTLYNSVHDSAWDINFGPTNCYCSDGRNRRGHIFVFWNGTHYFDSNSVIAMTFKNYYLNDIGVAGTRTLTNTGKNTWNFVANLVITYTDGKTATWNSTRTNTLVNISSHYYYSVTGSASGTCKSGKPYNVSITSPLYADATPWWLGGCCWIEAGTVTITLPSLPTITVDFGDIINPPKCDNQATVTVNSHTYTIYMW